MCRGWTADRGRFISRIRHEVLGLHTLLGWALGSFRKDVESAAIAVGQLITSVDDVGSKILDVGGNVPTVHREEG
jgi:hypothetical protein